MLRDREIEPIPWLADAKKKLKLLNPPIEGQRYQAHLYAILIEGYTETNGIYGVYVGVSRYTPENRFKQHKEGAHAANLVKNRGIQVLHSLCWPWRTVPGGREERLLWETALHHCLELAVSRVRGDTVKLEDIPPDFQALLYERRQADSI